MAKCGCTSSVCNCVLQAGDGIDVSGAGTALNPYLIAADAGDAISVLDTPTVNLTLAGTVLSADVIVDPVAGNTLVAGAAGLSVPCEAIQDCVGNAFGSGLTYDDAANQFLAHLSTDPGNIVGLGGDNGLYAAAGAFSCASLSTCPINSLSDVDTVTSPPTANELIRFDGANWVPLPVGCGLTVSALGINLDTTAFATLTRRNANDLIDVPGTTALGAGCNLQGQPIYCDTNGDLRTKPEKFTDTEVVSINEGFSPAQTIPFQTSDITLTIVNPSPCYAMCGFVVMSSILYESSTGNSNPQTFYSFDIDNGGGFSEFGVRMRDTRGISSVSQERTRFSSPLNICLDPGETKNIVFRVRWDQGPVSGGGSTQILAAAREIRWHGTNI